MEEIKIDFKTIIFTIGISFIIGIVLWGGYNIYISLTVDENEGIPYFEGETSTGVGTIGKIENSQEFDTNNIVIGEQEFSINNTMPTPIKEGWEKRIYKYHEASHTTMYYVPNDWEDYAGISEKDGIRINAHTLQIKDLTPETTYEEFLDKFIKTLETKENSLDEIQNYTKRQLSIGGENLWVLVEEEYYNSIHMYFCLAQGQYTHYLEASLSKDDYDQEAINTIDEIFSTFRINH